MRNHSSILAWRIPWTRDQVDYGPWGCKESEVNEQANPCYINRKDLANVDEAGTSLYIFRILTLNKLKLS